jgi:hypothetical protein
LEDTRFTNEVPPNQIKFNDRECTRSAGASSLLSGERVGFVPAILLTKCEVFDACTRLSNIERLLAQAGQIEEASWAAAIFDQLEERLAEREWGEASPLSGSKY